MVEWTTPSNEFYGDWMTYMIGQAAAPVVYQSLFMYQVFGDLTAGGSYVVDTSNFGFAGPIVGAFTGPIVGWTLLAYLLPGLWSFGMQFYGSWSKLGVYFFNFFGVFIIDIFFYLVTEVLGASVMGGGDQVRS